jgi:5'-nucleotidase (lipoprotein e(P4) family)
MRSAWIFPLFVLGACATAGGTTRTATTAGQAADSARAAAPTRRPADTARASLLASGQPPHALHWTRTSAEHHAILLQAYRGAEAQLRELVASLPGGSWAVIMDADETVLDNSLYFQQQAEQGRLGFGFRSWIAFVKEAKAPALPGAVHFTHLVHELGGRLVIVTNRAENLCADTRRNLERAQIPADAVLCRPQGGDDKNPRFAAVQNGKVEGLPPLRVVMWVGDNIQDFPGQTQAEAKDAHDSAFGEFGHSWWILPNPIYGSWERNPMPATP